MPETTFRYIVEVVLRRRCGHGVHQYHAAPRSRLTDFLKTDRGALKPRYAFLKTVFIFGLLCPLCRLMRSCAGNAPAPRA